MNTPSFAERELKKAGSLVKEDATAISSLAAEAARSGAYVYPIRGVLYFISHPALFESVKPTIIKSITMSTIVLGLMTVFTYLPQVAVLAFVSGPLAFIAAVPVVLGESWLIITFLNKAFYVKEASEKVFDAVLAQRGFSDLVEKGRTVRKGGGGGMTLGKSLLKPISGKFSTEGLVRYVISLPLNAIPAVGTLFFLFYNGQNAGPSYHNRYFQLKGLSSSEHAAFIQKRRGAYTSFGAVSLALGLIPIIGTAFSFSSAAGAALWASDLEKKERGGNPAASSAPEAEVAMGHIDEL